jgi:hypothetical protein
LISFGLKAIIVEKFASGEVVEVAEVRIMKFNPFQPLQHLQLLQPTPNQLK